MKFLPLIDLRASINFIKFKPKYEEDEGKDGEDKEEEKDEEDEKNEKEKESLSVSSEYNLTCRSRGSSKKKTLDDLVLKTNVHSSSPLWS